MHLEASRLLDNAGGFATTAQLLTALTRQQLDVQVKNGGLVRVWYGIYAAEEPDLLGRLAALDLFMGREAVACMGTAAALYGFDTESTVAIHVLDPGVRMRPALGLLVHQRTGAPPAACCKSSCYRTSVDRCRNSTRTKTPARTCDSRCRPALDVVHRCRHREGSHRAAKAPGNCRGARTAAVCGWACRSAMESEARLIMIDYGLPLPELQYEIRGIDGELWRVDFAWPEARIAAEYESIDWHAGRAAMLRDKTRQAKLQELGWTIIPHCRR